MLRSAQTRWARRSSVLAAPAAACGPGAPAPAALEQLEQLQEAVLEAGAAVQQLSSVDGGTHQVEQKYRGVCHFQAEEMMMMMMMMIRAMSGSTPIAHVAAGEVRKRPSAHEQL